MVTSNGELRRVCSRVGEIAERLECAVFQHFRFSRLIRFGCLRFTSLKAAECAVLQTLRAF
jgi:hypothetical protein